ncbi:MAG: flagellar biosynthesis anti-sigma factor FlgM, partial [Gammaproteobacteria bacterium]|nr:flagellar biosynthesis anti-sigma factor FlgM [Gammaproteobacteria bacterium]
DPINSNNRIKAPSPASDQGAKKSAKAGAESAASSPASTVVELSSSQIMKQMENVPEVDSSKVEAIKTALANGEYQPDPEVIARKFSELETLLP